MSVKYTIALEKQPGGGYTSQCLEVPGAISQGETREEAVRNCKDALQLVLEVLREEAREADVAHIEV